MVASPNLIEHDINICGGNFMAKDLFKRPQFGFDDHALRVTRLRLGRTTLVFRGASRHLSTHVSHSAKSENQLDGSDHHSSRLDIARASS